MPSTTDRWMTRPRDLRCGTTCWRRLDEVDVGDQRSLQVGSRPARPRPTRGLAFLSGPGRTAKERSLSCCSTCEMRGKTCGRRGWFRWNCVNVGPVVSDAAPDSEIGEKLRRERLERGMSQKQ